MVGFLRDSPSTGTSSVSGLSAAKRDPNLPYLPSASRKPSW